MRSWNDWKEIKNIVKEQLDSKSFSYGDLDMAYDDNFVDFMLSTSGNDVFVRIDETDDEKLMLVIDNDAINRRKDRVNELLKNREFLKSTFLIDYEVVESNFDKKVILSLEGEVNNHQIATDIARTFIVLWPYIEGVERIDDIQKTECFENTSTNLIDNKKSAEQTNEMENEVYESSHEIANDKTGKTYEEPEELEDIIVDNPSTEDVSAIDETSEINNDDMSIENIDEMSDDREFVDEMIAGESIETPDKYNRIEEAVEEISAEKTFAFGNVYITDNIPNRNGRVRLIKQVIGNTSLQLFFLLPDEEEHYVQIESCDSTDLLDSVEAYCRNQFRFFAFPKSPDKTIFVKVFLDGKYSYGRRFKMPKHLRIVKKEEGIHKPEIDKKVEITDTEIITNTTTEEKIESISYLDLDMLISTEEISIIAGKVLKGE